MELKSLKAQPNKLQTIDKIRRNYNFMKFSLLPGLHNFKNDLRWMAEKIDITIEEAFHFQEELVTNGLWLKLDNGNIIVAEEFENYSPEIDDNQKVLNFLTLNANIASQISNDGPCWFEYSTVSTTTELRKEFLNKINEIHKEFIKKSKNVKGTELISWSHIFLNALDANAKTEQEVQ